MDRKLKFLTITVIEVFSHVLSNLLSHVFEEILSPIFVEIFEPYMSHFDLFTTLLCGSRILEDGFGRNFKPVKRRGPKGSHFAMGVLTELQLLSNFVSCALNFNHE